MENSKNLIWDCDAEKTQLSICMNHETDEGQIKEWTEEAKACNQDIIYACWNIIQIQRHMGVPIDEKVREEWIKAYKWEKNNMPENGVDYDTIIWAIENL